MKLFECESLCEARGSQELSNCWGHDLVIGASYGPVDLFMAQALSVDDLSFVLFTFEC